MLEKNLGAGRGTRTPTVSRPILSRVRLPFRHPGVDSSRNISAFAVLVKAKTKYDSGAISQQAKTTSQTPCEAQHK